ncbi:cache domain-containing protein [Poseidonibacter lekithochrous]|uniref:cache domain-containing protein n=1 Tax=Poseidonibacter lekithochrous TaxID=1904463 RepID=UPI0008FC33CC|nr:cache domain-containing protein [Poseidonibacter lekithochrous]QKJ21520.1 multi-sensor domain-containing signal transduction histidine kinase [Poseidonibacter lekithochrous]
MIKNDEHKILQIIKFSPPLVIVFASIIITFLIYVDYKNTLEVEKSQIKSSFINKKKDFIKEHVEIAIRYANKELKNTELKLRSKLSHQLINAKTIINSIYKNNKDTKTKEEITILIKDALRDIRFNKGRGYFFIHEMNGVNVLHPILPSREGTNISKKRDKNGVQRFKVVQDIVKEQTSGYAIFDFFYPLEKEKQKKKLVHVDKFEPYNWMIGTGEYIEDFEKEIQEKVVNHLSSIRISEDKFFIILNKEGTIISHPFKNYNNRNILKDDEFIHFREQFEQVKKLKDGEGAYYLNNHSLKLSTNEKIPKLWFVKPFDKWNWVITTGFYLSEIEPLIKEKEVYLEKKYTDYLNTIIVSSIIVTISLLFISIYIARILEESFLRYKNKLEDEITENIKQKNILEKAHEVAYIGSWELQIDNMQLDLSDQALLIAELSSNYKNSEFKALENMVIKADWQDFYKAVKNTINTGEELKSIYRIVTSSGQIKWIHCRGKLNAEKNSILGVIQDITETKNLEKEKQKQEELLYQQSKMAAMGEMIGNIAHQWRQPLSSISISASGAKFQKEMGILTDEIFYSLMDTINDKTQYLSQTIDDFRNFYKPDKTKNLFTTKSVYEKTIKLVSTQFLSKQIQINDNIEDVEIFSIENELIQVLINILNNARDAFEKTKDIKKFVSINIYTEDKKVYIEILDNAGGVPIHIIDRIFEPYFTTKHQSQGTGIGLYMSEEIIKKHLNGNIYVKNKEFTYEDIQYKGASFTIVLDKFTNSTKES